VEWGFLPAAAYDSTLWRVMPVHQTFSFVVACFISFGSCILAALYYYFIVVDNVSKIAISMCCWFPNLDPKMASCIFFNAVALQGFV
jgi:hypothetical protein